MHAAHAASPRQQQGAAALVVVMVLCFVMMLAPVFANKSLLFEQKTSINQYRSTQALEAAEAGIEWTLARLNGGRLDDQCRPSEGATSATLRDRYLQIDGSDGFVRLTASRATPMCVKGDPGWNCACPATGSAIPARPDGPAMQPAFAVELAQADQPGVLRLSAHGCTSLGRQCTQGAISEPADAHAKVTVDLALLPALRTIPIAALTAGGRVDITSASVGVENSDPHGHGVTIHARLGITADNARIVGAPGTPAAASMVANDPGLGIDPARFFALFFGMDKALYQRLPTVKRIHCAADCTGVLQRAAQDGYRMIWADNDLSLHDAVVGSPTDPLILIVDGNVRLSGNAQFHGLVYSSAATWDDAGSGNALVRGAAIAQGDFKGTGASRYVYDPAILQRLSLTRGTFAKVPGSWKDFQ
jgi:hypothetical protein